MPRFLTTLLFACWSWAFVLAALPELHEAAHGHEEHECAATLIATGSCDTPDAAPVVLCAPAIVTIAALSLWSGDVPALFLVRSPLEHGPPRAGV